MCCLSYRAFICGSVLAGCLTPTGKYTTSQRNENPANKIVCTLYSTTPIYVTDE